MPVTAGSEENGKYFLNQLLRVQEAYPNVLVNAITAIEPSSWNEQTARHDLVIVDRLDCPPTATGNLLVIDAYSPSLPFEKVGQAAFPQILDWERDSPLMRDVNLRGVTIEATALIQPEGDQRPVVEAAQTGLIYAYEEEGLRAVFLGFDLTRSDLPLRVAFPVLLSNIINWLNPQKLTVSAFRADAGEPYPIYLSPHTQEFFVRPPGQRAQKYAADANPLLFTATTDLGVYTITENQKPRYFTVNLVNAAESDIRPASLSAAPGQTSELTDAIQAQQPLWPVGALLCLLLLAGEWGVWLRTG
jgi:Ca-activated chloride channel homolog